MIVLMMNSNISSAESKWKVFHVGGHDHVDTETMHIIVMDVILHHFLGALQTRGVWLVGEGWVWLVVWLT